ncbi:molybdopterin synthase sulfur carrier subunit [Elaeis guineensis]|uniref:Molybdopterin synthase sulfur carrier subunit n=1 Tax=Elaeis guineensis var. tenera TaxID=51953 RepID=A0A6I9QTA3_ELAGV|nr:molybdopterin synthase sulfur carrier subunit [Elaeis guineensis]XP_029118834.1 molybdopterin synthase sulfur carrier subunit [Elaeis guineensis]XP_029118835.1 molybdopterin synthase sulfur carrier subunit [Elaeis guineensis]
MTLVIPLFRAREVTSMAEESEDTCAANKAGGVTKMQKTSDMEEREVGPWIEVKVLFFARARELTGLTDISLLMPPQSTARDCMSKLLNNFPKLEEIYNSMVLALNEEYVPESTVLRNRDELAIIPPISGG